MHTLEGTVEYPFVRSCFEERFGTNMTLVGPGKVVACTTILFLIIQVSRVQAASISAVNVHALSSRNASTGHVRPSGSLAMAATPRQSGDQTAEPSASVAVGELRLLALPVGQGDSTVIVCPEYDGNIVIYDMGSTQQAWSADRVRSYLEESTINGERSLMDRLTTIIISHAHTDHYNYIPQVFPHFLERHRKRLNSTQARRRNSTRSGNDREQDTHKHPSEALSSHQLDKLNVFVSGKLEDYIYYDMEEWLTAAGAQTFNAGEECFMSECSRGNSWTESICGAASDARFRVISANMGLDGGNKNEQSVVLRVDIGSHNALLVGDFEGEAQVELIDKVDTTEPGLLISDVYKVCIEVLFIIQLL